MKQRDSKLGTAALMAAAAALLPEIGHTQGQPEQAVLAFKYLDYVDLQRSGDRMHIRAPLVYGVAPVGANWGVEGSATLDSMSGASPLFYSALSGASRLGVRDTRRAGDMRLTRYFEDNSIGVGAAVSDENDYTSRTLSVDGRHTTEDRNTTFAAGVSATEDDIGSVNNRFLHEGRHAREYMIGVTQVLSPLAIVQSNLMHMESNGYHSDPYKTLDIRPRSRYSWAWLTRYNRFVPAWDGALQTSYRYFEDSWNIRAHTVEAAWHQNLPYGWTVRPSVRYYTQHAAYFFGEQFPPTTFAGPMSYDQRVSSFGAWSASLKVTKALNSHASVDIKFEGYEQRASWSAYQTPNVPIEPFRYRLLSVGLNYRF